MYRNPRDYRTFFIYLFYGIIIISVLCQSPKLINENDDLTGLKTAGYWDENPIFIDGDATGVDAHNWTWVETQVWFGGGNGTWKNPYIIENITIDGSDSANCFEIRDSSVFFIVRNCTFYNSSSGEYDAGIKLENTNNGTIIQNNCSSNGANGLVIINGKNNTISGNNIFNNSQDGIFLHLSNNNTFLENDIIDNTQYGAFLNLSESNTLYLNNFSVNGLHAIDNGTFNIWDNGTIGNYWDNYTELGAGAVDANDDGIGDIPYDISGSAGAKDYYPIWDDGDDIAPSITINAPTNLTSWNTPPPINVTVYDPNFDSLWYRVGGDIEFLVNNTAEFLNASIWGGLGEGPFQLEIFANDSAGNINNTYTLTLFKDTLNPSIVINTPTNLTYWFAPPSINITIYDDNFDSLWYRVNGITEPLTNNTAEFLNASIWGGLDDGPFQIEIFANDTLGNLNDTYVLTLYKDTLNPSIVINTPANLTYWNTPPSINITVYDDYFDSLWYRANGITEPLTNNTAEFLNASIWGGLGEGPFQLEIFANDSAGNINNTYVLTLYKDTLNPSIIINTPANLTYWNTPPSINITIYDDNFDSLWYRANGIIEPLTNNTAEFLNASIWGGLGEGPFLLEIMANDTLGNLNDTYVLTLYKDTTNPILTINSPLNNSIWATPPLINVTVYDMYFDSLWYMVNGITEPLTNNTEELLLGSIWGSLFEGPFQIYFYANDSAGNLNNTYVFTLTKQAPLYQTFINTPANGTYWDSRPPINVTVYGPDMDTIWYQVDATIEILTNNTEELLLNSIWGTLYDGPFDLHIWVNDTFGVLQDHKVLTLYKDTLNPSIVINVPMNQTYWNNPPPINITVYDDNYDSLWYRVNGITEPLTNNTVEFLNALIWSGLGEEPFQLEIFANDTLGHVNNTFVLTLYKDTIAPRIVVNTPTDLTYWETPPPINVTVYDINFDSLWYRVGATNQPLTNNSEDFLLTSIWNGLSDGMFQIEIYANDTAGNLNNTVTLTLYKDILNPMIFINSPLNQSYWNSPPLINIIVYEAHLDTIWYKVSGTVETLTNNTDELLLSSIWSGLGQEWFIIEFYANDTTGKLNDTYILTLYKDTIVPEIIINIPLNLTYWDTPPLINITVYDINFDSLWYKVGVSTELLINSTEVLLLASIWNSLSDGVFLLEIMANDSAGNINNTYVLTLYKDVLAPDITINYPLIGEQFTQNAPTFNLTIIEVTHDTSWYSLNNGTHWSKNITFTGSTGIINQTLWDSMPEGVIIIQFYANDSYGRIGYVNVVVIKKLPTGFDLLEFLTSIPGIITMSTIAAVVVIAIVVVKKKRGAYKSKKKEIRRIHEIRRKRREELK